MHRLADIRPILGAAEIIRAARDAGLTCGLVTNQAGIGRGYFGWSEFEAVQQEIERGLARAGAGLDFVLACPFHPDATGETYRHPAHPWRKPLPGMIEAVLDRYGAPAASSTIVGDTLSDIEAGAAAGLGTLVHVATGHGRRERMATVKWAAHPGRKVTFLDSIRDLAIDACPSHGSRTRGVMSRTCS